MGSHLLARGAGGGGYLFVKLKVAFWMTNPVRVKKHLNNNNSSLKFEYMATQPLAASQ